MSKPSIRSSIYETPTTVTEQSNVYLKEEKGGVKTINHSIPLYMEMRWYTFIFRNIFKNIFIFFYDYQLTIHPFAFYVLLYRSYCVVIL